MANQENQPNHEESYAAWQDPELIERAKGDIEYFIRLVDEAKARHDFEEAVQEGISDKRYRQLQDNLQYFKDERTSYEVENSHKQVPEDGPS